MKKIYWIFIALILLLQPYAASYAYDDYAKKEFDLACAKYDSGEYEESAIVFQSIVNSGIMSGNILYNLGNAYLKCNKLGYAILSYERAKLVIPRDSDLISNYKYAKSLIKQKEAFSKKSFLLVGLDTLFSYLTIWETYFLFMFFYYSIVILIVSSIFLTGLRKYSIPIIIVHIVLWVFISVPMVSKFIDLSSMGVIVSDIVDVKFEPSERAAMSFPMYAGMRVRILSTSGQWRKIMRPDGKIGWVERESVLPLSEEAQLI